MLPRLKKLIIFIVLSCCKNQSHKDLDFREMKGNFSPFDMRSIANDLPLIDYDLQVEEAEWDNWQTIDDQGATPNATAPTLNIIFQFVSVGTTELRDLSVDVPFNESFGDIKQRLQFNSALLVLPPAVIWLEDDDTPASVGMWDMYNHVAVIYPEEEVMLEMNTVFEGSLFLRFHIDTSLELALTEACTNFCRPLQMMEPVYATDSVSGHWSLSRLEVINTAHTPRQLRWGNDDAKEYYTHVVELRSPGYDFP